MLESSGGRPVADFRPHLMDTIFCYGESGTLRRSTSSHDLSSAAWKENEPFSFNGKFTKLRT